MKKIYCDRCGVEFPECEETNGKYELGDYGASLKKAIAFGDKEDIEIYPADYVCDLCPDCQNALNSLVRDFMKSGKG